MAADSLRTVADVIGVYVSHLKSRLAVGNYSPHGYEDVSRELKRFCDRYGGKLLSECKKYDLTKWLDDNPQWRSPWTRKRNMGIVVRPFLWAEDEQLIDVSPYRNVKRLRKGRPRRHATQLEYVTLMRFGSRELRRALFFMRRCGARTEEVRDLVWTEINFDLGVIVIEEHKMVDQLEQPEPRVIALDAATLRFLRNLHKRKRPGQDRVFVNCSGTPWDRHTFARHMHRWAERLGLAPTAVKLSPYCFRHTFGTNSALAGLSDREIADLLGHADTRMANHYIHTAGNIERLRRIAEEALKRRRGTN